MCQTHGSQEWSKVVLSLWKWQNFRVIFANICLTHRMAFSVPSWWQLWYRGGQSSSWFLDGFKFQLKPAQALSASKLKTAAVWISSCQAKQVDYKRLHLLLMISRVWNSCLSKSCWSMSLCHQSGRVPSILLVFSLIFLFILLGTFTVKVNPYWMTKATHIWELEARFPMSLKNSWTLVQGVPFWSVCALTLSHLTVEEDSHDSVMLSCMVTQTSVSNE